jgi:8-oxo-dGTP pyrophosphatase MutT (NUDIX family)
MQKAVSIVVVQGKKAFLGTRLNLLDNYRKRCFPGGKVEDGESCLQSACRELHQETGFLTTELLPLGKLMLQNPDFGAYEAHGFAVRLPPKVRLVNMEPKKNGGWRAIPLIHILKMRDEKLLPGTKFFVKAASSQFGLSQVPTSNRERHRTKKHEVFYRRTNSAAEEAPRPQS